MKRWGRVLEDDPLEVIVSSLFLYVFKFTLVVPCLILLE